MTAIHIVVYPLSTIDNKNDNTTVVVNNYSCTVLISKVCDSNVCRKRSDAVYRLVPFKIFFKIYYSSSGISVDAVVCC